MSSGDEEQLLLQFLAAVENAGAEKIATLEWSHDQVSAAVWPDCVDQFHREGVTLTVEDGKLRGDVERLRSMSGSKECVRYKSIDDWRNVVKAIPGARLDALSRANADGLLLKDRGSVQDGRLLYFATNPMYPPIEDEMCNVTADLYMYTLPDWQSSLDDIQVRPGSGPLTQTLELIDGDRFVREDNSVTCVAVPTHDTFYQGSGVQRPQGLIPEGASGCELAVREFFHNLIDQTTEFRYCDQGWAVFQIDDQEQSLGVASQSDNFWEIRNGGSSCRSALDGTEAPPAVLSYLSDC